MVKMGYYENIIIKIRKKIDVHVVCIEFVLLYVWVCCAKCGMKSNSIKGIKNFMMLCDLLNC